MDIGAQQYAVVLNHEDQYSVWLAGRDLPAGWRLEGFTSPKQECLRYIDGVWHDIRPLSLRLAIGERTRVSTP